MARTGKIARAPFDIRQQVNAKLRDGASAAKKASGGMVAWKRSVAT
jgi:hypothetical protein